MFTLKLQCYDFNFHVSRSNVANFYQFYSTVIHLVIVIRNGQSGNTNRLNRNLYVMLKFTEWPKTPGITSKKTWLSLKGISCLQVTFVLIWMKQTLIWFNFQRDGTGNRLSNTKHTFAESLQLQRSVLDQSMCILKAGSLSSSYDGQAKYKEKASDVSDPNQNGDTKCNSKLKFT